MPFTKVLVNPSDFQKRKMYLNIIHSKPFSIRLGEKHFSNGSIPVLLHSNQLLKLRRTFMKGAGKQAVIKFKKTQVYMNKPFINNLSEFMPNKLKDYSKLFHPLSTDELNRFLRAIPNFKGVYAKDVIPDVIEGCGVINLDKSTEGGTHWTAWFVRGKKKKVLYFDSFGLEPPKELVDKIKAKNQDIIYSDNQLQHDDSIMCGWFVIHFITEMSKKKDFFEYIESWDETPTDKNEDRIRNFGRVWMRRRGSYLN